MDKETRQHFLFQNLSRTHSLSLSLPLSEKMVHTRTRHPQRHLIDFWLAVIESSVADEPSKSGRWPGSLAQNKQPRTKWNQQSGLQFSLDRCLWGRLPVSSSVNEGEKIKLVHTQSLIWSLATGTYANSMLRYFKLAVKPRPFWCYTRSSPCCLLFSPFWAFSFCCGRFLGQPNGDRATRIAHHFASDYLKE